MKFRLILYLTSVITLFACDGKGIEELLSDPPHSLSKEVSFTSMKSSASDTNFKTGDEIGIYAVKRIGSDKGTLLSSGNAADNKRFRYDGSQFVAASDADKIYFEDGTVFDYYAYYPYTSGISDVTAFNFSVSSDQTVNYSVNDLCWASNESGAMGSPISLSFKHKLSMVQATFKAGSGKSVTSASINGIVPDATLNLQTGAVSTLGNIGHSINMYSYGGSDGIYVFRSLQPAQTLKNGNLLFSFTIDGQERQYKASDDLAMAEGTKYFFDFGLKYKINTTAGANGTVSGGGIYDCGQSVIVSALAASGYSCDGWFEGGTLVSSSKDYTFNVLADRNLEARFSQQKALISLTTTGRGTTGGAGEYVIGQSCTVTATEYPSYYFAGWFDGGIQVSASSSYTFTVTGSRTLEARFLPRDVYVEVKFVSMGLGVLGDGPLAYGSVKINPYYFQDGQRMIYYPEYNLNVFLSFTYNAAQASNGANLGSRTCTGIPLSIAPYSSYNFYHLFYWSDAMVSTNRMTDLTSILNMRLDRSQDTSIRKYIFMDSSIDFYRTSPFDSDENNYIFIKSLTNQKNSNY
ncbi:MAG: fimbrillin family protein [Bacteroidota bacterium]|nr:fimbrillin family protein [Bacteroidota bacterium]